MWPLHDEMGSGIVKVLELSKACILLAMTATCYAFAALE